MKNWFTTFLMILPAIVLSSCGEHEQTQISPEGKVKLETIDIAPKIAGRIEKIFIQEGQQVHKGDTLAIVSVPEIAAKLEQANGALEAAMGQLDLAKNGATEDQLQQVQSQVEAAEAQMLFARQSYHRLENMFRDSLIPAQQFDDARSKFEMSQAQVKAIKAKQKEILSGTRKETIQSAKGQVQRALGARNEVFQAEKERYLVAPSDMLIESVNLQEGELATPGYSFVTGTVNQSLYFRFSINEKEISQYKVGQKLNIGIPGEERIIAAKIVAVKQLPRYADNTSTAPNRKPGESLYEIRLRPEQVNETPGLYNNSTVFIKP